VQDVTPAVRKLVLARDRHRCRVPGCRSAQHIDVHHIIHRWQGGSHEPSNLVALCSGHHAAHHEGCLAIRGTADALEVVRAQQHEPENFHGEIVEAKASKIDEMRADATPALTGLGFTKREATRAVSETLAEDEPRDLEALIRGARRRCSS
jgi:hypothetical protein